MNKSIIHKPLQSAGRTQLSSLITLLIFLGVASLVYVNRQNLNDWRLLRGYTAPPAIAQLATEDTLTPQARKIFYVNHPQVQAKAGFINSCPAGTEQTIVLGCYKSLQAGIFLSDVNDPRLDGVKQVTAAHEMLHAAYDRLSSSERRRVDGLLLDFYRTQLADERIKNTIDSYKKTEPADLVNEMHSIFGTEIAKLPPSLEVYYKTYFNDRAKVASYSAQYQAEFTSRQAKVIADDIQLNKLKAQIDANETDLASQQSAIAAKQEELNAQRRANNLEAYNAGVGPFNALIDSYNQKVQLVREQIRQYNQLVNERNAIALEEDQLSKSLSNDTAPLRAQ